MVVSEFLRIVGQLEEFESQSTRSSKKKTVVFTKLRVERGVYVFDYWVDRGMTEEMKGHMSGNSRQAKL